MVKLEFKDYSAVLLVCAAVLAVLALIGTNPFASPAVLPTGVRFGLGGLGLVFLVLLVILQVRPQHTPAAPKPDDEYRERFRQTQEQLADIVPENRMLASCTVGSTKLDVISGSITEARAAVIVSSDDNYFTARGGVAKSIGEKAGALVKEELARYSAQRFRQGQLAVTSGGDWSCRAILHAAVIDLDENRYPTTAVIADLVRNCLQCALAVGAGSIAFPILGGGTASKHLTAAASLTTIVSAAAEFLQSDQAQALRHVAVYVYGGLDTPACVQAVEAAGLAPAPDGEAVPAAPSVPTPPRA